MMFRPLERTAPEAATRTARFAFGIGLLAFLVSIALGILALLHSQSEQFAYDKERAIQGARAGAAALDELNDGPLDEGALEHLKENFEPFRRYRSAKIAVVDATERVLMHSASPELIGASAAKLFEVVSDEPRPQFQSLVDPWSGVVDVGGVEHFAVVAAAKNRGVALLSMIPLEEFEGATHDATLPWVLVLGFIVLVLIPVPLFLLYRASNQALAAEADARRRAETSEAALAATIESLPYEVWVHDMEGRIQLQNANGIRANGLMIGKHVSEVGLDEGSRSFWEDNVARALRGETVEVEYVRSVEGDLHSYQSVLAPIRTEYGLSGATGITLETTRQRKVERELALAMQRTQAHIDNSPLGLIEWDGNLQIIRWSGASERLFGWSRDEVTGKPITELHSPIDLARGVRDSLLAMRERGVDRLVFEGPIRSCDGRELVCIWHNSLLRDEHGKIVSILSQLQDITEQKHASDLRSIQERLLERIASGATTQAALDDLLLAIEAVLPDARSSILFTDKDGSRLRSAVSRGLATAFSDAIDGLAIGPHSAVCGSAAWHKRCIVSEDTDNDPLLVEYRDLLWEHEIRSIWSQPILSMEGDVLGTFALYFDKPRTPSVEDLKFLETAASLARLALVRRNTRWIEETQREILKAILDEHPIANILHDLVVGIERQVPGMIGGVLLREPDGLHLRPAAGPSFDPEIIAALDGLLISPDGGTCGIACYRRELYASEDFEHDPNMVAFWPLLAKHGLRSGWSQPIFSGDGEVLGTFAMYWRQLRRPGARERELLETATSLAALAIERHNARAITVTQQEIMRLVLEGAPIERTLSVLLSGMERQLLGARGAVFMSSPDEATLTVVAAPSMSQAYTRGMRLVPISKDASACGRACTTRATVIVADTEKDPLAEGARELFAHESVRAAWSIPVLSARGEVLGTTSLYWREPRSPTKRESALLDLASNMAGIAIERFRHEEQRRRLTRQLETLNEIGRAVLASDTIEGIAGAAVERVRIQLECARVSVTMLESDTNHAKLIAVACGPTSNVRAGLEVGTGSLAHRKLPDLQAGRVVTFERLAELEQPSELITKLAAEGIKSSVLAPVALQGKLLGTLNVGLDRAGRLSAADEKFLSEVSDMLALAIEQIRLHESEQGLTTRLMTLHEVGRGILEEHSEPAIALSSVERIVDVLGCHRASVLAFDPATETFTVTAQVSRGETRIPLGSKLEREKVAFGDFERLRSGEQYNVENVAGTSPRLRIHELLLEESVLSYTVTPLVVAGQFVGVLTAGRSKTGRFQEVELQFLREIANLLAVGLRQARLAVQLRAHAEEQRKLSERLASLNQVGRAILHSRTTNELMTTALSATRAAIGIPRASVSLIDEDRRRVTLAAVDSTAKTLVPPGQCVPLGAFPFEDHGRLRRGDVIWIDNVEELQSRSSSFPALLREGVRSVAQIPLLAGEQLLGTLNLCFASTSPAATGDIGLGREIAGLLAVGLLQLQLHERVRQNAEELERRVLERTLELTEVNEELESYVRTVSHDLRAPLRTIQGLGTAVLEDYGPRLDVDGLDYLARVTSAAERMDRMLLDLLAYSRMGKTEIVSKTLSISDAVREARALVHSVLEANGAVVHVASSLHSARGHGPTLVQAISNLLSNAAKFRRPGVAPSIRITTEQISNRIRINIEDNGIGIPAEHHDRIFRAFERLHAHDEYPGTGIGLAIVRRAAERMGGSAGVESAPAEGSRFWIELPATNQTP